MRRIVLLLASFCLFSFKVHSENTICQQKNCIAVVDAGSTGSRIHLYAYDLDYNNAPIAIDEIWTKKINPGFSTLDPKEDIINAYLESLFAEAPEQNMPVYFYATAGMRLLPQQKQQLYYQALQKWFLTQSQWQLAASKTITGSEEGVFGWLAVNYQLGAFNSSSKPLTGVMDMGGASLQITLPVQNTQQIDPNDLISIDIANRHIDLFVHSFLGLGQTLLTQQFLDNEHCFSNGYILPSGLKGKGDAYLCKQDVKKLINSVHQVNKLVKPVVEKNPPYAWYTVSGLAKLAQDKPFSFQNEQITASGLLKQSNSSVCHQQWQVLFDQYPNNDFLYGLCLVSSYYYTLLVDGYGMKPQQSINYISSGPGSDWSLGVVLHQP